MSSHGNNFMSKKAYKSFDRVLKEFGNPFLLQEYNSLPYDGNARHRLLDSFAGKCRDGFIHGTFNKSSSSEHDGDEIKNKKCSLYKALLDLNIPKDEISEALLDNLRGIISIWGAPPLVPPAITLMMHEQRVAAHKAKNMEHNLFTSDSAVSKSSSNQLLSNLTIGGHDWSSFKSIGIKNLKLFDTCLGSMLKGELVVDPFTPMVGTVSYLKDSEGDLILVCFYNILPSGAVGHEAEVLANNMLPKGSRICIAEPFLKIFKDGSRGIRVDDPKDIKFINNSSSSLSSPSAIVSFEEREKVLVKAKNEGNTFFGKKMYHAAVETYIGGLRKDDFIPTLLSNRAQANIHLGDWSGALLDAAASLTLRPVSKKTWLRYKMALNTILQLDDGRKDRDDNKNHSKESNSKNSTLDIDMAQFVMSYVLKTRGDCKHGEKQSIPQSDNITNNNNNNNYDAQKLKAKANCEFTNKRYYEACCLYSQSLQKAGFLTRAILSNWSQCGIFLNSPHDAIAASTASLRIEPDDKAVCRLAKSLSMLGEENLGCMALDTYDGKWDEKSLMHANELRSVLIKNISASTSPSCVRQMWKYTKYSSNWLGNIETYDTKTKGRGVRAIDDLVAGEIIIIERPIVEILHEKNSNFFISTNGKKMNDTTGTLIRNAVFSRMQRDGLLSQIISYLYDGNTIPNLVPFPVLLRNLASVPILLPPHHEYIPGSCTNLSLEQVSNIIDKNSHGIHSKENDLNDFSELCPATSMFNHSNQPSCVYLKLPSNCMGLVTTRAVRKGEELTVQYHPDEDVVKSNWL